MDTPKLQVNFHMLLLSRILLKDRTTNPSISFRLMKIRVNLWDDQWTQATCGEQDVVRGRRETWPPSSVVYFRRPMMSSFFVEYRHISRSWFLPGFHSILFSENLFQSATSDSDSSCSFEIDREPSRQKIPPHPNKSTIPGHCISSSDQSNLIQDKSQPFTRPTDEICHTSTRQAIRTVRATYARG